MSSKSPRYCLDANVLIQAWQKYYSPKLCPGYWEMLIALGAQNRIFIPDAVYDEIIRTEDDLAKWLKDSKIPVEKITGPVTLEMKKVLEKAPTLVDNTKQRSLADPWLIAHALLENACVVTKEERITTQTSKVRIPNVCDSMNVRCINDFQMLVELDVKFGCTIGAI